MNDENTIIIGSESSEPTDNTQWNANPTFSLSSTPVEERAVGEEVAVEGSPHPDTLPAARAARGEGASPKASPQPPTQACRGRRGKIARLPASIRQQLDVRLENGEPGAPLVLWLNGLPEAQAVLAAQFGSQPITENNLKNWKQGGYRDWIDDQRALQAASAVFEQAEGLRDLAQEDLADRMTLVLTAKMAMELQRLNSLPDGEKKFKGCRELLSSLVLVRRGHLQGERIAVEREKLSFRRDRHREHQEAEFWQWIENPEYRDNILGPLLTPEQNEQEMARRNEEMRRQAREIMGLDWDNQSPVDAA